MQAFKAIVCVDFLGSIFLTGCNLREILLDEGIIPQLACYLIFKSELL